MAIRDAIKTARWVAERGDPHLAVFMVRDYEETASAGLSDLAWAMHHEGCAVSEAVWLLDTLEKHLNAQAEAQA